MKSSLKIKRILIAVEDSSYSEKASAYGLEMARLLGAEVGLLHVNGLPAAVPYMADPLVNDPQLIVPELMQVQEEAGKKLVNDLAEKMGEGLKIFTFNKLGNAEDEIILTAQEWKADLIILGTHGRTGLDHFLSGSVAETVVRKSNCAVLVVPKES